jgi:hypothetical protein
MEATDLYKVALVAIKGVGEQSPTGNATVGTFNIAAASSGVSR